MTTPGAPRGASPADPARPSHDSLFEDPLDLPPSPGQPIPQHPGDGASDDLEDPLDIFFAPRSASRVAAPPPPAPAPHRQVDQDPDLPSDHASRAPVDAAVAASPAEPHRADHGRPADDDVGTPPDPWPAGSTTSGSQTPERHAPDLAAPDPIALDDDGVDGEPAPAIPQASAVDTGRLFRSTGADGPAASVAIPALTGDLALTRGDRLTGSPAGEAGPVDAGVPAPGDGSPMGSPALPDGVPVALAAGAAAATTGAAGSPGADGVAGLAGPPVIPGGAGGPGVPTRTAGDTGSTTSRRGITAAGVWVLITGVTVLAAFADALLHGSAGLGWITGAALVVSTLVAALTVRAEDMWLAVIVPPLAFLIATLTAGQLTLPGGQGLLIREGVMIFTTLSLNAPWLLGATALALVVVLVRRFVLRRTAR